MRLRFWEPPAVVPLPMSTSDVQNFVMPARHLNLTDLSQFGRVMARVVGKGEDAYSLKRRVYGSDGMLVDLPVDLSDLDDMSAAQMAEVRLEATRADESVVNPASSGMQFGTVSLSLGDGMGLPAHLSAFGVPNAASLLDEWARLGRPRRTRVWVYPTLFLLCLVLGLAPLVVAWAMGQLSLWLLPTVVGVIPLAFAAFAPVLQRRVSAHRQERVGLELQFFRLRELRRQRGVRQLELRSGLIGAVLGGVLGATATVLAAVIQ